MEKKVIKQITFSDLKQLIKIGALMRCPYNIAIYTLMWFNRGVVKCSSIHRGRQQCKREIIPIFGQTIGVYLTMQN